MHNPVKQATDSLRGLITAAVAAAQKAGALPEGSLPDFVIEIPGDTAHGDFASNVAMVSAKAFRLPPMKIAAAILECLDLSGSLFTRAQQAGPGFINFFLSSAWFEGVVSAVLADGADYGKSDFGQKQKVMVEFVSANPTGPMHMGNARGGAIGDCLAAAMRWAGYDVTEEFYVNDAGNQIEKFGISLYARYMQQYKGEENFPFPEDGYHGEDIKDRAQEFSALQGDALLSLSPEQAKAALVAYALPKNIGALKSDLSRYRIEYDVWFHESSLYESGTVQKIVDILTQRGLTYENDGALWYKATEFGAEKDEVLIRQNGNPTYFAADIAYHYNKFTERGFTRVINVWGADHHGHVARLKGAMDAIGLSGERLDIIIMQLVRLMKNGEPYRMSKRSGRSITLADLLEEIPIDAARFFFNMREPGSALDFDLDLAAEQSSQNPVYYVQYAHARICSIEGKLRTENLLPPAPSVATGSLTQPEELELCRALARMPGEIIEAARSYDPARLTRYAIEVATLLHKFYNAHRVVTEDISQMHARIALCFATRQVLRNCLGLLKITAPDTM